MTLRLGEVMRDRPLVTVLYERGERGEPFAWAEPPAPGAFRVKVTVRTPGGRGVGLPPARQYARGERLGLSEDELAFYDALETNDSAVQVLGDETLRAIARELVDTVRNNVTIDWTLRENVRARLRAMVKRILRKNGYPPDKQEKATVTVLEQAEVLFEGWATA